MTKDRSMDNGIARSIVNLEHGRISFFETGEGTPVFFLHGLNGNGASWQDQFRTLSGQFRMWAWDAPGYGLSDVVGDTVTALAQAALAFLRSQTDVPVHVVGHSMGGLVAMKMAAMAPEKVKRLVLSCTHPGHGLAQNEGANQRYQRRLRELEELSAEEYGQRRAKGMLPEGTAPDIVHKVARVAAESRPEGMANAAWAIQTANLVPDLGAIQAKTLVITCDEDRVAPLSKAQPLLDHIQDVQHRSLEGLGHAPYMEDVARYNSVLREFLVND